MFCFLGFLGPGAEGLSAQLSWPRLVGVPVCWLGRTVPRLRTAIPLQCEARMSGSALMFRAELADNEIASEQSRRGRFDLSSLPDKSVQPPRP